MAFSSIKDFTDKVVTGGQSHSAHFRKTTAVATTAGVWFDGSMMSGHPVTNFYASTPLDAATLLAREGIQHGSNQSPSFKHLKRVTAMCSVAPVNLLMVDTLLYFPFIDGDSTDEQVFTYNATAALPRYTSGEGVLAYVVAQGAYVGGARFQINYTNSAGVSGRITNWCTSNVSTTAGTLISSGVAARTFGWNIPLLPGDLGIKSVQSFTFETTNSGIFALVLCYPLGALAIREANVPAEKDFLIDTGLAMPRIYDDAYLSFLVLPNASIAAAPIYGSIQTVWG